MEIYHTQTFHQRIRALLREHENPWSGKRGHIHATTESRDLVTAARPFQSGLFLDGPKACEVEEFLIKRQLAAGVIEYYNADWPVPFIFGSEKNGWLRLCVQYWKLNTMTIKNSYPLAHIDEWIDALGESCILSALDALKGYGKINIAEQHICNTSSLVHSGRFHYIRMPSRLTEEPATFQCSLDLILARVKWKIWIHYMDDIIIFWKHIEEHVHHEDQIITTVGEADLTIKLKKSRLFSNYVD